MKPCSNIALQQYVEENYRNAPTPEAIEAAARKEARRINEKLSELWPVLQSRLQQFRPAFEEWVTACIEQVLVLPTYRYIDWDFHVYRSVNDKNPYIWYSNEVKLTDLPPEAAEAVQVAVIQASKIALFKQLTDFTKAKDWNTEDVFDGDFMSIIEPADEVIWYYTSACDPDRLWFFQIDIDDLSGRSHYLHEAWRLMEDLLPPDIACLLNIPTPEAADTDHAEDGAACALP